MHKYKEYSREDNCGCGGFCRWLNKSDEDKIKMLEAKETELKKMLSHIEQVKTSLSGEVSSDKEEDKEEDDDEEEDEEEEDKDGFKK